MLSSSSKLVSAFKQMFKQTKLHNKDKVKFVGRDNQGNKYYEAYRPNHSRMYQRYFEKENITMDMNVVDVANVPPAWDSWLRFKRQEPPTEEELKESEQYFKMQQELEAQRKVEEESNKLEETQISGSRTTPQKRKFPKLSKSGDEI